MTIFIIFHRQLREYILVQHYTTHNSLDESSPNSKTQYTVRDITYSILESTREASSHDSLSSSHNSSIHEIALEKSSHDWNTEDTIRAIKKGEYELPLKKFQEVRSFLFRL